MMWHKSGGPSSRKVPFVAKRCQGFAIGYAGRQGQILTKGISSRDDGFSQFILEEFRHVFQDVTHLGIILKYTGEQALWRTTDNWVAVRLIIIIKTPY